MRLLPPLLSVALLTATLTPVQAEPRIADEADSTSALCSLSKVKKWTALGSRWALGSDANGRALALYDLSFSTLDDRRDLGRIGGPRPDAAELARELNASREMIAETPEEKAETDRAIARLTAQEMREISAPAGGTLAATVSSAEDLGDWVGQIPWKKVYGLDQTSEKARALLLAQSFTLDDVDLESTIDDLKEYQSNVAWIENEFVEAGEGPVKVRDIYRHLRFNRQADGSYDIVFEGTDNPAGLRKIAGIACVRDVRFTARVWNAFRNVFSLIFNKIRNAAVQGVFATALNRYSHYQELKLESHLAMVTEALVAADQGEGGPLASLPQEDRDNMKLSILLSQDSAIASLKRIFRAPRYEWTNFVSQEQTRTADGLAWLQQSGAEFSLLNPRFALQTRGQGSERAALLTLPRKSSYKKGPYVSYRYDSPEAIRARRIWIEREIIAVDFASRLIPLWGIVVRKVNERLLQSPMDTQKIWEARLTHVLEERERTLEGERGAWESEIETLDRQRVNPLEIPRSTMLSRVAAIKARLGI